MVPASNASLVNGTMLRYLDYNDFYGGIGAHVRAGWHPSETIPAVLAVGESVHATGREILKGIIMAYEIGNRGMCRNACRCGTTFRNECETDCKRHRNFRGNGHVRDTRCNAG
jgi:hypothetical protein